MWVQLAGYEGCGMMGAVQMTKIEKYVICAIVVAVGVWVGREWLQAHDELRQAEAIISLNEQAHKQEVATLQAQIAAIGAQVKGAATPVEKVAVATKLLPALPTPLLVGQATKEEPVPPIIIPPADQQPLLQIVGDCATCQLKVKADEEQIAELTKERDAALKVAKGGSFIRRVARGAKIFGIGLGIGLAIGAHGI